MTFILSATDAIHDRAAGGKARALALAERAGLPVPPWFVVSGDAIAAAYDAACVLANVGGRPGSLGEGQRDRHFRTEVEDALRRLCPSGELVAVRSSAVDEDGLQHSFAGQLETFLNVRPWSVLDKIHAVWQSGFSDRILAYRREHGLTALPKPPSVVVQRMVCARVAGVAFSADPVSGRRGISIVSAVPGLGSALVSGEAEADTWHVDRAGAIVHRHIPIKRRMHVADEGAPGGVRSQTISGADAEKPLLTDTEVRAVADLARRSARELERPQDIEWAYEDDRLLLLQSRPITSIEDLPDPDGTRAIWDNSNIVESYSGITTPLTFSFAREIYEHVYRQFCRLMRVPDQTIARHDDTFRNMLGLLRGRLYYNLLNWYRVLALLPGFRLNRRFMEQMMGVREPLPSALADEIARSNTRGRFADAVHLAWTVTGLVATHVTLERRIRAFYRRLDDALAAPEPPLADRRPDELAAHYRDLRRRLLLSWDAPLVNDFFAMIFYGLLRHATRTWWGDTEGTLQNDLIGGDGGMVSAEPAIRMQQLARLASARPELIERLIDGTVDGIQAEMRNAPDFRSAFESYLEKFGDRTVNELKLESATLHDDPLPLFRGVGALAAQMVRAQVEGTAAPTGDTAGDRLRAEARQRVADTLANRPIRRLIFGWLLRNARARVRDRENLRLERTRLFGWVRRIFVEIGRRFHAQNLLDDPRDVFYLEVDEVLAFVDGRATSTNLRGLAALRRDEFLSYESQPEPGSRFETYGVVYRGHDFRGASEPEQQTGDERRGIGCSPGHVRGPVRIVKDPRFVDLQHRSILVAEHTDPGWIMVFPSALGVLVERGSLLSHAAIVARELGIPAVVSVPGLTEWLQDGDWVEFDGATGAIRRVAGPDADGAVHAE